MSATSRPDCGRASGALSILTAIAGRGAAAAVVTVPSATLVSGVTAATGFGVALPPPQAAVASETRPITATALRRGKRNSPTPYVRTRQCLDIPASALEPAVRQSE